MPRYAAFGKQSAWDTPVDPTLVLDFFSESISPRQNVRYEDTAAWRNSNVYAPGIFEIGGDLELPLCTGMVTLFEGLLGKMSGDGSSTAPYTFEPDEVIPAYTCLLYTSPSPRDRG